MDHWMARNLLNVDYPRFSCCLNNTVYLFFLGGHSFFNSKSQHFVLLAPWPTTRPLRLLWLGTGKQGLLQAEMCTRMGLTLWGGVTVVTATFFLWSRWKLVNNELLVVPGDPAEWTVTETICWAGLLLLTEGPCPASEAEALEAEDYVYWNFVTSTNSRLVALIPHHRQTFLFSSTATSATEISHLCCHSWNSLWLMIFSSFILRVAWFSSFVLRYGQVFSSWFVQNESSFVDGWTRRVWF